MHHQVEAHRLSAPATIRLKARYRLTRNRMPQAGQIAPKFTLPSSTGGNVSLEDFAGNKTVVLYFYAKDDTPG